MRGIERATREGNVQLTEHGLRISDAGQPEPVLHLDTARRGSQAFRAGRYRRSRGGHRG
jgi:hypothetical protein